MSTVPETPLSVNLESAILAAATRAKAAFPDARCRIEKGLALLLADHVTDCTRVRPRWFTVRSATDPQVVYDVVSNGSTVCNCPDYLKHATATNDYCCKHGYSVLLLRAARRDLRLPPLCTTYRRHAYHLVDGVEGHARLLDDGQYALFYPGGRQHSFKCRVEDLCVGPSVKGPTPN